MYCSKVQAYVFVFVGSVQSSNVHRSCHMRGAYVIMFVHDQIILHAAALRHLLLAKQTIEIYLSQCLHEIFHKLAYENLLLTIHQLSHYDKKATGRFKPSSLYKTDM